PWLARHGEVIDVSVEATDQEGVPRTKLKVSAALVAPNAESTEVALTETSAGRYQGHAILPGSGEFVLRAGAAGMTVERPVHIAYPAAFDFLRADPERLAALAAVTGGRILGGDSQIFGD